MKPEQKLKKFLGGLIVGVLLLVVVWPGVVWAQSPHPDPCQDFESYKTQVRVWCQDAESPQTCYEMMMFAAIVAECPEDSSTPASVATAVPPPPPPPTAIATPLPSPLPPSLPAPTPTPGATVVEVPTTAPTPTPTETRPAPIIVPIPEKGLGLSGAPLPIPPLGGSFPGGPLLEKVLTLGGVLAFFAIGLNWDRISRWLTAAREGVSPAEVAAKETGTGIAQPGAPQAPVSGGRSDYLERLY